MSLLLKSALQSAKLQQHSVAARCAATQSERWFATKEAASDSTDNADGSPNFNVSTENGSLPERVQKRAASAAAFVGQGVQALASKAKEKVTGTNLANEGHDPAAGAMENGPPGESAADKYARINANKAKDPEISGASAPVSEMYPSMKEAASKQSST